MPRLELVSNWEEYAAIKKWKKGLRYNSHKNRLSLKTEEAMRNYMPLFIEYTQKNPDDLIEEALNGKETVKARLSDFCNWLQDIKHKKFNQSVNATYSIIRGFYSHNDINTQKIRSPKVQPSEVQFSDDRVPLFDIVDVKQSDGTTVKKQQLRKEFLKNFYDCLSPRNKIIAMCIKDCGLDSSDLLDLPLALLRYQDHSHERVFIRDMRNKSGESVSTFLSKESSKLVQNYAKLNRKDALDGDPIFAETEQEFKARFHKEKGRRFDPNLDEMIRRSVDPHLLSRSFRVATLKLEKILSSTDKAQKLLQPLKQSPLRPKRFRKVFSDACDSAGIPVDIKRVFMGKSDPANKTYESKSRQSLELYYERVEPFLTVYSIDVEPKRDEEIESLKQQIENLEDDSKLRNDVAVNEILKMRSEIDDLKKK